MMTDIEIAQAANPLKIGEIAQAAGVDEKYLEQYGNYKAKVDYNLLKETEGKDGKFDSGDRDQPDSSRRRKDHDHGRSGRRIETSWQKGNRSAS